MKNKKYFLSTFFSVIFLLFSFVFLPPTTVKADYAARINYSCSDGWTLKGDNDRNRICAKPAIKFDTCADSYYPIYENGIGLGCSALPVWSEVNHGFDATTYSCTEGILADPTCAVTNHIYASCDYGVDCVKPTIISYTCPSGGTLSGATCIVAAPVDGSCGTAARTFAASETSWGSYTACFKGSGTLPTFPLAGATATWKCTGSGGGSEASCTATRDGASCTLPWGTTIASGSNETAYSTSSVSCGSSCSSQSRTCTNGSLSGSYTNRNCSVDSCTVTCTNFDYSNWGACISGVQSRIATRAYPDGCEGGTQILTRSCPTVSLSASPTSIPVGNSSTLTWSTTNSPTTCTASGGTFTGVKAISGSQVVSPASTTAYSISCSKVGYPDAVANATVGTYTLCTSFDYGAWSGVCTGGIETRPITASYPAGCTGGSPITTRTCPTVTLNAVPNPVANGGGSTTLSWSTTDNPTSCSASSSGGDGIFTGSKAITGSEPVFQTTATTYAITCKKDEYPDATATKKVTVACGAPYVCSNPAPDCTGKAGQTLTGTVSCIDSCSASVSPLSLCGASCVAQTKTCVDPSAIPWREVAP